MYHRIEDIYNRENHQNYQMLQRFLVFSPIINTFFLVWIIKDTVKEQYHKHAPQDLNLHLTGLESAMLPIAPMAYKESQSNDSSVIDRYKRTKAQIQGIIEESSG